MRIATLLSSVFALLLSTNALSAQMSQMDKDYESLKNGGVDYTVFGTICEKVAALRFAAKYPVENYEIITGIVYGNGQRVVGELDVVIMDRDAEEAILIAEVKCWKNLPGALSKANKQLKRFQDAMFNHTVTEMEGADDRRPYEASQFDEEPRTMTVSQNGGERVGFDMTLGLTMDEVKTLRKKIIRCQEHNNCVRPQED